jgi:hypothetical protein
MKAWVRVMSGLKYLTEHPAIAQALVSHGDAYFPTAELESKSWVQLHDATEQAHIFEFDDDTARLMELTDTEPHDVRLPFPLVFLDCTFAVNLAKIHNRYAGILLYQSSGSEIRDTHSITGPGMQLNVPRGTVLPESVIITNRISACAFIIEPGKPWITNVFYPLDVDPREMYGKTLGVGRRNVSMSRYGTREWTAMRNIALNFLDLLNTPDVYIVQLRRGRKNQDRRKREGKPALPPSDIVYLRPSIRRYVDDLKSSGQWNVSHRFWVRGHFRHYRADRYERVQRNDEIRVEAGGNEARIGKCPTCHGVEFIKPFIKGRGLLIKKRYRKAAAT